jgi:hypothetical protein
MLITSTLQYRLQDGSTGVTDDYQTNISQLGEGGIHKIETYAKDGH